MVITTNAAAHPAMGPAPPNLRPYPHEDHPKQAKDGEGADLLGANRVIELARRHDHHEDYEGGEPPPSEEEAAQEKAEHDQG
jgi:hypothetical protein